MLLAVDVGNTQTHLGAFNGEELAADWRFATTPESSSDELALLVGGMLGSGGYSFDDVDSSIVATVVPELGPAYAQLFERQRGDTGLEVGPQLTTGMPIRVDNPLELGADRLVNAVAAYDRVGAACVTVDFGTSTNFDAVSDAGEYLGGAIGPGLEVSIEALSGRTAKLPRIDLAEPPAAIGRNTQAAMHSGFVYGFAALVDGLSRRIADEAGAGAGARVIATGGLAGSVAPFCETIDEIDPLLTLKGLRYIFELNAR